MIHTWKYIGISILVLFWGCKQQEKRVENPASVVHEQEDVAIPVYDFEGLMTALEGNTKKVKIVNFWATWCKPCVAELPYFEMINRRYKAEDVTVILVSLDHVSEINSKLLPFIRKQQIRSEVVVLDDVDADTWISKVDEEWTGAIPATVIYTENQHYFYEQTFTYQSLETALKKVLK